MKKVKPIIFRGGGDIATGSISMLYRAGFPVIVTEIKNPSAIRRTVSFCEAVYNNEATVENIKCVKCDTPKDAIDMATSGKLPIIVDDTLNILSEYKPDILIDGILAKKNIGTKIDMADMVIALGPGFVAGIDCNYVIETMRGHRLGRIIDKGSAIKNTGIPGVIAGYSSERVIHASDEGTWEIVADIGSTVKKGDVIAKIITSDGSKNVYATIDGIVRGSIKNGYHVTAGLKSADIDPRVEERDNCWLISDKARCIAGSVLELVCKYYNN